MIIIFFVSYVAKCVYTRIAHVPSGRAQTECNKYSERPSHASYGKIKLFALYTTNFVLFFCFFAIGKCVLNVIWLRRYLTKRCNSYIFYLFFFFAILFHCRSANYYQATGLCELSEMDRITLAGSNAFQVADGMYTIVHYSFIHLFYAWLKLLILSLFLQINNLFPFIIVKNICVFVCVAGADYLENNCAEEPNKLCEFKRISGRILKTVDSVYQDVSNVDECRELCLNSPYR